MDIVIKARGLTGKIYLIAQSPYYRMRFYHPEKRRRQRISLGTSDLPTAKVKAKLILERTADEGIKALQGFMRRDTSNTVGKACDHYLMISPVAYRRDNVNCLYRVIKAALQTDDGQKVRDLALSRLNRALVAAYLKNAKVKTSTQKSCLASARAIFARQNDWEGFDGLPDMSEFRDACTRTGLRVHLDAFQPLPAETLEEIDKATRVTGGGIRRAWILARYLGLRPSEIAGFRKGWIERRGEQHFLCVRQRPSEDFALKTGSRGERDIGIPPDMAAELLACDDYGIPGGTPYTRYNWLMRVFNAFLRGYLPHRDQLLYTLRKQAGSDWLVATGKISLVSKLLGHTSAAVTLRHYATYESSVTLPEGMFGAT
jgi:integrase